MARFNCNVCGAGFEGRGCGCDATPEACGQVDEYVDLLSTMFVGGLAKAMGPANFHEFCRRTMHEFDETVCHSHDYLDANVIMAEAYGLAVGKPLDLNDDADLYLVNAAWTRAKRFIAGKEIN